MNVNAERKFQEGLFGEYHNPSEAFCKINENYPLYSDLIPRKLFPKLFLKSSCGRTKTYVIRIDDVSDRESIIYHNCNLENSRIRMFANMNNLTYDEVKKKKKNGLESYCIESMLRKMKVINLDISRENHVKYNSALYETLILDCGVSSEVISHPRKIRVLEREKTNVNEPVSEDISSSKPNIILLLVDSESRKRFERDFPKTTHYMEELRATSDKTNIYQFFKHHSAGYTTRLQSKILFNGNRHQSEKPFWVDAKENGYITTYAIDICENSYSLYCDEYLTNHYQGTANFDYHFMEMFCTPELVDPDNNFQFFKGPYRSGRRCEFGKDEHVFLLEYLMKIQDLFPRNPKFMIAWFNPSHEFSGQGIQYMDEDILKYLKYMDEKGAFEDTFLIIGSDHGNHVSFMYNLFTHIDLEDVLPSLYFFLPKKYEGKLYSSEILGINRNRLFSFNDLHHTIKKIFGGNVKPANGYSKSRPFDILNEEIPFNRTCKDIQYLKKKCACVQNEAKPFLKKW